MKTLIKSALLLLLVMSLTACLDKPRAYESYQECIIRELQKCGSEACVNLIKYPSLSDTQPFGDLVGWCNNPSNWDKN